MDMTSGRNRPKS